jgi:LysR family glycine cleavage system transcriptional activator
VNRLPPFFALRALEAAARHRSYSRAADELGVTHGAVSQQIRRLEAELAARLFERRANTMIPTPEAERLAREVRRGMDVLYRAVGEFTAAGELDPLVVSVDPQFASRWLPSRLPRLLAHPAGGNLEIRVEDRCADFLTDGVDMGLRYGDGVWDGLHVARLFKEVLIPVCSPKVAAERPIRCSRQLASASLLHHAHRPWSLWFEAHGLPPPPQQGLLFDDSLMLYEAAAQGLGVALARLGLVDPDLEAGRLVRALPGEVVTNLGFFVVWRGDSRKLARILALRDWLTAEVRASIAPDASRAA